jgi:hypothetical protein
MSEYLHVRFLEIMYDLPLRGRTDDSPYYSGLCGVINENGFVRLPPATTS